MTVYTVPQTAEEVEAETVGSLFTIACQVPGAMTWTVLPLLLNGWVLSCLEEAAAREV